MRVGITVWFDVQLERTLEPSEAQAARAVEVAMQDAFMRCNTSKVDIGGDERCSVSFVESAPRASNEALLAEALECRKEAFSEVGMADDFSWGAGRESFYLSADILKLRATILECAAAIVGAR